MAKGIFLSILRGAEKASVTAFRNTRHLSEDAKVTAESIFSHINIQKQGTKNILNTFEEIETNSSKTLLKNAAKNSEEARETITSRVKNIFGEKKRTPKKQNFNGRNKNVTKPNSSNIENRANLRGENPIERSPQSTNRRTGFREKNVSEKKLQNTVNEVEHSKGNRSIGNHSEINKPRENSSAIKKHKQSKNQINSVRKNPSQTKQTISKNSGKSISINNKPASIRKFSPKAAKLKLNSFIKKITLSKINGLAKERINSFLEKLSGKTVFVKCTKSVLKNTPKFRKISIPHKYAATKGTLQERRIRLSSKTPVLASMKESMTIPAKKLMAVPAKKKITKAKRIYVKNPDTKGFAAIEENTFGSGILNNTAARKISEQKAILLLASDTITLDETIQMIGKQGAFECIFKNPVLLKRYEHEAIKYITEQNRVEDLEKIATSGRAIELILNFNRVDNKTLLYKCLEEKASSLQKYLFKDKIKTAA